MDIAVYPSKLNGSFRAPDSKSQLIRLLLLAALADRPTRVARSGTCEDSARMADCLARMGAEIDGETVRPIKKPGFSTLDCGESATVLRFLLAVTAALGVGAELKMGNGLAARPHGALVDALREHGADISRSENAFTVSGKLHGGRFKLRGDVSSQFISALLIAAPLVSEPCEIIIEGKSESRGYVDMTLNAMAEFGVRPEIMTNTMFFSGKQMYISPGNAKIEGDWSGAATILTASSISLGDVSCVNLSKKSAQRDSAILDILRKFSLETGPFEFDMADTPDIAGLVAARAAYSNATTYLLNAGRLKYKECDRFSAICDELTNIGADVRLGGDSIIIRGHGSLRGGCADSHGDHRMEMMLAAAACGCGTRVVIKNGGVTAKSYPDFYDDMRALGARIEVL